MSTEGEKTNAMRLLEARGIDYRPCCFSSDIHSAEGVAQAVGYPLARVFKSLVTIPDTRRGQPVVVVVPGHRELDLKKLARHLGVKKVRMASRQEAEDATGLLVGGISPLALLARGYAVIVDRSACDEEQLLLSAGKRGINLEIAVDDLLTLTEADVADLAQEAD